MTNFKNKNVAVLGLGIEGRDAINFLLSKGAEVTLLDKKEESELDFSGVKKSKIKLVTGKDYLKDLKNYDYVVRSPGVYRYLPEIVKAEKEGVKITSAVKIFFEDCPAKIIGVTGTKGKGTTSSLIYEILKADKRSAYLSGNIGKPYLELLPKLTKDSWVVMEMSSFQLIDLDISPYVAVVLNITLDHMDWHKNRKEYVEAKRNIVSHQKKNDFAVINFDYDTPKSFVSSVKGKLVEFSKSTLESRFENDLLLRGVHNLENIAAAVAVGQILRIDDDTIERAVKSFRGLEHRLELVDTINGVTFYNDSFATGPQPTIAAINSFTEPETVILGGSDKGLNYGELRSEIGDKENVKNIILIGEIGEKIGGGIKNKNVVNLGKTSMIKIVRKALKITPKGGVVILSPAAASFDMFKNYKERGLQFKKAVKDLKDE
jgi:UDP-N-acetylmuramoylalanine--D-glutamate ligase